MERAVWGGKERMELLIQPAFNLASVSVEHRWFLVALLEAEWTARRKATTRRQIDQAWWLTRDEHWVGIAAQTRDACH